MEYKRNTISKRNLKQSAKQTAKQTQVNRNKRKARAARRNKKAKAANSIVINRTETWFSEFCSGDNTNMFSRDFSEQFFPKWFRSYSKLYQFYKINFIEFEVYTTASTYTSGSITAGFELSSYDEVAESPEMLMAYANAKQCPIHQKLRVRLNGSMLTNTPSFRNTTGSNSYSFNFQMFVDTSIDVTLFVKVHYSITLKVPQIVRALTTTLNNTLEKNGEIVLENEDYDLYKLGTGDRVSIDAAGSCYLGRDALNLSSVTVGQANLIGGFETYRQLADVTAAYVGQDTVYSSVDLSNANQNYPYYGLANLFIRAAVPLVIAVAKNKYSKLLKY